MKQETLIENRLLGADGFGPNKFNYTEGVLVLDRMVCWHKSLQIDKAKSLPLDAKKCQQVVNIARHNREKSFAINGNGNGTAEAWEQIRTLAKDFSTLEGEAYFRLSESDPGFQEARDATMVALSSGHVLDEVRRFAEEYGSPGLKRWFEQLKPSLQKELEIIVSRAAQEFWSSFVSKGWSMLAEWRKRIEYQKKVHQELDEVRRLTLNGSVRYDNEHMVERQQPAKDLDQATDNDLTPEDLIDALYVLTAQMYGDTEAKPGRRSSRIEGVIKAIEDSGRTEIPLEDLERSFDHTQNPRKTAASYMSDITKLLNLSQSPVTIDAETVYRFRRRPAPEVVSE